MLLDIYHRTFEQALVAATKAHDAKRHRLAREHAKAALELAKTGPQKSGILALVARCCEAEQELSGAKVAYEQIVRTPDAPAADKAQAQAGLKKIDALAASKRVKDWKLVFSDDFERKTLGQDWQALVGNWGIVDGKLVTQKGVDNQIILTRRVPGPQRIEFDAVTHAKRPCDLSPFIHANANGRLSGYLLQFGGSGNKFNSLRRGEVFMTAKCVDQFIERGKVHKMVAEFDGAAVRLTVDGATILEYFEANPLSGKEHESLGFYIYSSGAVDNLKVYTPNR